jgi:hypothetical protein
MTHETATLLIRCLLAGMGLMVLVVLPLVLLRLWRDTRMGRW